MKLAEFAKQNDLNADQLLEWLLNSKYKYKAGFLGGYEILEDQNLQEIADEFKRYLKPEQDRIAQEQAEIARAHHQKQVAMANMLITSGFSFDGYTITKYSGYISGDDAVQIDRGTSGVFSRATDVGTSLMASLSQIRRNALTELKEAAYALGCNAVIGVDFDYLTLDPQTATSAGGMIYLPYVFGVTANGNAVIIEKAVNL